MATTENFRKLILKFCFSSISYPVLLFITTIKRLSGFLNFYVGQTQQHLLTQFREHNYKKTKAVYKHFRDCVGSEVILNDIKILAQTSRNLDFVLSLEALFIREYGPALNVKDEYQSRELTIRF